MSQEQKTILLPLAEYQELQYWMDRSDGKGHLDGTDVLEPWRKLQAAAAALSPTTSDAGKDDARDAAPPEVPRGWEDAIAEARNAIDCDEPTGLDRSGYKEYANVVLDGVADKLAALSSLEVIGKGEKG